MANRNYASGGKLYSMHVMPVMIDCIITIGNTGAVTSFSGSTVASVTRTGQGVYKVKLQDSYAALLHASGAMISPSSGFSTVAAIEVDNATDVTIASGAEIVVQTLAATSSSVTTLIAVDPASTSKIQVLAILNNSKVKTSSSST